MPEHKDLDHSDWAIRQVKHMVHKVNREINVSYIPREGLSSLIRLSNVSESDLEQLTFLTNTGGERHNYLYLEGMYSYTLTNDKQTLNLPGFDVLMKELWDKADNAAYLSGKQTFSPFKNPFFNPAIGSKTQISVGQYIDTFLQMTQYDRSTYGIPKYFSLSINPDDCSECTSRGLSCYQMNNGKVICGE